MKTTLAFTLLFLSHICFGQYFAIVSDKDGYCNVRTAAGTGNKILDSLHNGHFVLCFDTKDGWTSINYGKGKQDTSGYVYHDRLQLISDYEKIPNQKGSDSIFVKDSLKVVVCVRKFVKARHRVILNKESPQDVESIDGRKIWGTDGEMPRSEYKSIVVYSGSNRLDLPKAAYEDLFEPSLYYTKVNYDRQHDILYIQSSNSDGAGSYVVIWKIEKGEYAGRYVTGDD